MFINIFGVTLHNNLRFYLCFQNTLNYFSKKHTKDYVEVIGDLSAPNKFYALSEHREEIP